MSLIPNADLGSITADSLLTHPSVTQPLVQGENVVRFTVGDKNGLMPTVSPDLQWSEKMAASMTLVIWTRGGITSQIDGSWQACVYMRSFEMTDRQGYGLVHSLRLSGNNLRLPWTKPDWWHNVFFWDFKEALTKEFTHNLNLHSLMMSAIKVEERGTVLLRSGPSALQIISTSSFVRAKIFVKITWWKRPDKKVADCVHVVSASVFPDGLEAMAQDHYVSSEASGSMTFSYVVQGPFDGMRFVGNAWSIAGQSGEATLRMSLDGPSTCRNLSVSVKIDELHFGNASNGWVTADADAKLNTAL